MPKVKRYSEVIDRLTQLEDDVKMKVVDPRMSHARVRCLTAVASMTNAAVRYHRHRGEVLNEPFYDRACTRTGSKKPSAKKP